MKKLTIENITKIADELEIDYNFKEGCDTINEYCKARRYIRKEI